MEGNEGGGINVSALQSYLHQQQSAGTSQEDEETVFSVFVFLTWFYKNVPCYLDSVTGNISASVTCLGMSLPTTIVLGSEMQKNIFGLPKLLPDPQPGDATAGDAGGGADDGAAAGGDDPDAMQLVHPDDPYAQDNYPHADQDVAAAAGHGLDDVALQQEPEYHHDRSPSPTPVTQHGNQYDHDFH
ncbi:hypothetical protein [Ehrlichia canis]|uniref:Uncharacterized protein n=1 Tax=Ehrlichia canis (strain Jake) TaxID=269484 RepID=A0ACA6AVP3_EHRCJ|nr:hypothetical protein [Ehrlichia canis]AAZ68536.1 hypothetical protein Ecaj_0500 [Ehrlichia canis str. Jake]